MVPLARPARYRGQYNERNYPRMPTTKDSREIVIETLASGDTPASTLSVRFLAEFVGEPGGAIVLQDTAQSDASIDRTKHELALVELDGTRIGDLTVKLVARTSFKNDFVGTSRVTSARADIDPRPSEGDVFLNREHEAHHLRVWKQRIKEGGKVRIVNVARVDAAFKLDDTRPYAINQTVTTQTDNLLALRYELLKGGRPYATGTLELNASSAATSPYMQGPIVVDDDDD